MLPFASPERERGIMCFFLLPPLKGEGDHVLFPLASPERGGGPRSGGGVSSDVCASDRTPQALCASSPFRGAETPQALRASSPFRGAEMLRAR